jgi:hypothetical protein
MKKTIALYALIVAALVAAPALVRAEDSPTKKPATAEAEAGAPAKKHGVPFRGTVSAVDAKAMTVKLASRTFSVTSETKITKEGKPAVFADITVGERITGQYKKDSTGKLEATIIHIGGKAEKTDGKKKAADADKN